MASAETASGEPGALRSRVALACRVLAENGHSDLVWGHASSRDPEGRGVWMKASRLGLDEITADDVLLVDRDGQVLEGSGSLHVEYPIHTEVMAARPDVGGVVHSHPEHGVALAAAGERLLPVSHAANLFVPPDVPRYDRTADLITTRELGREITEALGSHHALFLVNHGIVTVGPDVETAAVHAILLERACAQQLLVRGHGGWASWSPAAESLSKRANIYAPESLRAVWDYLVRRLGDGAEL
jgi:L-ribulose-5-phosphate 4-epimerase